MCDRQDKFCKFCSFYEIDTKIGILVACDVRKIKLQDSRIERTAYPLFAILVMSTRYRL